MRKARHYALRIGVLLVITADTLRRLFLQGPRPIDYVMLVIEFLVLVLIGGEMAIHAYRYFRHEKRKRALLANLFEGQRLISEAPSTSVADYETAHRWELLVTQWRGGTTALLRQYSDAAAATFSQPVGTLEATTHYANVSPYAQKGYREMQTGLNNLRLIIENPDTYL